MLFQAQDHGCSKLSQGFYYKHPRHNRIGGKMPLEERFIYGYIFIPLGIFPGNYFRYPVHQQKGISVRYPPDNFPNIQSHFILLISYIPLIIYRHAFAMLEDGGFGKLIQ
jgi:hypothetical protein